MLHLRPNVFSCKYLLHPAIQPTRPIGISIPVEIGVDLLASVVNVRPELL